MARKPKPPKELAGADEFAGPDAEKEAIEKIAQAKVAAEKEAEQDAKRKGDNGGPLLDEAAWKRAANELVAEQMEIDRLMEKVAEVRGRISSIKKVAEKCNVDWDVVKLYAKYQARISKGEMGEIVTEQRRLGALMRVMDCPLHTQFQLFPDQPDGEDGKPAEPTMEAELAGQHAYSQGAALTDNPYHAAQDVDRHNEWRHGWTQAQNAKARSMGPTETTH